MANTNLNIKQAFDYNVIGGLDTEGNIKTLTGKEAVINSLKVWLLSKTNDYIRKPGKGGYLYNWLCKPMSENVQRRIISSLRIGLDQDFYPRLIVKSLQVIPNYEKRYWTIIITGYVPSAKETIDFEQNFSSIV